jgi:hypothetical protein
MLHMGCMVQNVTGHTPEQVRDKIIALSSKMFAPSSQAKADQRCSRKHQASSLASQ